MTATPFTPEAISGHRTLKEEAPELTELALRTDIIAGVLLDLAAMTNPEVNTVEKVQKVTRTLEKGMEKISGMLLALNQR